MDIVEPQLRQHELSPGQALWYCSACKDPPTARSWVCQMIKPRRPCASLPHVKLYLNRSIIIIPPPPLIIIVGKLPDDVVNRSFVWLESKEEALAIHKATKAAKLVRPCAKPALQHSRTSLRRKELTSNWEAVLYSIETSNPEIP